MYLALRRSVCELITLLHAFTHPPNLFMDIDM